MNPKKLSNSHPVSPLVSRALKVAGVVITLAAILDILIVPFPYQFLDRNWQVEFATAAVDRGIVPLVGVVLFLAGCWVDSNAGTTVERKQIWKDSRFWVFVFSSLLGLFFLLMFPLHLNNVRLQHQAAVEQVGQRVTETETELNTRLQQEISTQRQQIEQLVTADAEQINQLQQNGQLTQEQADLIRKFKADPNSVDPFLKQREEELRNQLQTEIGVRKEEAQQSAKTEALKSGLRVGISSLLLAIGFAVIGWTGLRHIGQM